LRVQGFELRLGGEESKASYRWESQSREWKCLGRDSWVTPDKIFQGEFWLLLAIKILIDGDGTPIIFEWDDDKAGFDGWDPISEISLGLDINDLQERLQTLSKSLRVRFKK
jgi:hypothetical protein